MKPNRHPVFTGFCCLPALLLATGTLLEGTVIGIMLAVASLLASIISLLPSAQTSETRITLSVLFPALFAAFGTMIASTFFPWLTDDRGWLVPLSILSVGLAELFAADTTSTEAHETLRGSIYSSLSLLLTFLAFSLCREVLTYGTLMAYPGGKKGVLLPLLSGSVRPFFGSVAGALLLLALFAVLWRLIDDRRLIAAERKKAARAAEDEDEYADFERPEAPTEEEKPPVAPLGQIERVETVVSDETEPLPDEEIIPDETDSPEAPTDAETEVPEP